MAATVARLENIIGDAAGRPNLIVYFSDLDMDDAGSPITSANTLKVIRWDLTTGDPEYYVPGGGSNDFHDLDGGYGGVHGRGYLIIAKESFVLPNCFPGASEETNV